MAFSRYAGDSRINLGQQLETYKTVRAVRDAIRRGTMPVVRSFVTTGDDRLDTLSGTIYGDAKFWWVLAAASNIGWGLQVPIGTVINVVNISDVQRLVG